MTELREHLADPELQVLCGAGVSMVGPTLLPSGNQLRDLCVRALLRDSYAGHIVDDLLQTKSYQALLPEAVLQDVGLFASDHLDRFMSRVLDQARPNAVHQAIADRFECIFTTNFDTCFEASGPAQVIHLHGTVADPETLQNRVFRLGKGQDSDVETFHQRIHGRPLLIAGYSLRDDDIIESLENSPPARMLFLSYDGTVPPWLQLCDIPSSVATGTAEEFFDLPTADHAPEYDWTATVRQPSVGARASALLYLCYLAGQYVPSPDVLDAYLVKLKGRGRYKAICSVADCLRTERRFDDCREWIDVVLRSRYCRRTDQADILTTVHNLLALCALDEGSTEFEEIAAHYRLALEHLDTFATLPHDPQTEVGIEVFRARILNNLGLLYHRTGHFTEAIGAFASSCEIKRRHHDERGLAQTTSNLAKTYCRLKHWRKAATQLKAVVDFMVKSPDVYICKDAICEIIPTIVPLPTPVHHGDLPASRRKWNGLSRRADLSPPSIRKIWETLTDLNDILFSTVT